MGRVLSVILGLSLAFGQVAPVYADALTAAGISAADTAANAEVEGEDYQGNRQYEGASHDLLMNTLLTFAITFVGVTLWRICPKSTSVPSAMIFMGSGLVYLAAEIFTMGQYKEEIKDIQLIDEEGDYDKQIESFEKAKEESEATAKYLKKKATFASIAGYGMIAAGIAAFLEWVAEKTGSFGVSEGQFDLQCEGKDGGSEAESAPTGEVNNTPLESQLQIKDHQIPSIQKQINDAETNIDAYFVFSEYSRYKLGHNSSISIEKYQRVKNEFSDMPDEMFSISLPRENAFDQSLVAEKSISWKELFSVAVNNLQNMIVPKAQANILTGKFAPLIGVGGGAAAYFALSKLEGALKKMAKILFEKPVPNRVVSFPVMGGFALFVSNGNKKAAEAYQEQADDLQAMIDKLKQLKENQRAMDEGATQLTPLSLARKSELKPFSYCFTGVTEFNPDPNCNCKTNNTCKNPLFPNLTGSSARFSSPGVMATTNTDLAKTQKALFNGDLTEAQRVGQGVLDGRNAIRDLGKKLEGKVNDSLLKSGQSPIAFNAQRTRLTRGLASLGKKAIDKAGGPEAFAGSALSPDLAVIPKEKRQDKKSLLKAIQSDRVLRANNQKKGVKGGDFLAGLFAKDKKKTKKETSAETQQALDKLMAQGHNIHREDGANIFEIISSRYFKSAFPVLLEEEKKK